MGVDDALQLELKKITKLIDGRTSYNSLLNEIKEYFNPYGGDFHGVTTINGSEDKFAKIHNKCGIRDAAALGRILYSTVMPVHDEFFTLKPYIKKGGDRPTEEMETWFRETSSQLLEYLQASNLAKIAPLIFSSLVHFGNGMQFTDFIDGRLVFKGFYPENFYFGVSYDEEINEVVTVKKTTALNLFKKFGGAKPDRDEKEITIYNHYFEDKGGTWKLHVINKNDRKILAKYNFSVNPLQVPRWFENSYEPYGRSPAMEALGDYQVLNRIEKTMYRANERAVDPTIAMPFDASAIAHSLEYNSGPGGVIEYMVRADGKPNLPTVMNMSGTLQVGENMITKIEDSIHQTFMLDVLTAIMQVSAEASATQINAMSAEKLDIVGSMVNSIIEDYVKPTITTAFNILIENDMLSDPPEPVEQFNINISSSLVIRLQQQKVNQAMQTIQALGGADQFAPGVMKRLNPHGLSRFIVESSPIPAYALRTTKEIEDQEKADAKAAQEAQMMDKIGDIDPNKAPEEGSMLQKGGEAVALEGMGASGDLGQGMSGDISEMMGGM